MSRVDSLVITAKTKAQFGFRRAKEAVTCKLNGDSQIVVALVLIAVAVGLCVIFRDQINNIMGNLINTISNHITKLANPDTNTNINTTPAG